MKKYIYIAAALMMMGMGMSSCSNDNDAIDNIEQNTKKQLTFTVSFTDDAQTRAVWETTKKPKFEVGDKIGLYSANDLTAVEFEVAAVDASGNATISGTANTASEYHLVFPYKANSTYNTENGQISGFDNFTQEWPDNGVTKYPATALHYAKATGSAASVVFQNLCAILKVKKNGEMMTIRQACYKNPIIYTTGDGSPKVTATSARGSMVLSGQNGDMYLPVAPGSVTVSWMSEQTITVVAGKVYTLKADM